MMTKLTLPISLLRSPPSPFSCCRLYSLARRAQRQTSRRIRRLRPKRPAPAPTEPNRALAYYHLALASVYEDDASPRAAPTSVNRAIEEYKLALNADPDSAELNNGLADLYFRIGRVHDAEVTARRC